MVLLYIILSVYIVAVNCYAVMLLVSQRNEFGDNPAKPIGDGKIILAAILGGALAIYVSMFVMRYRIKNILFMILMPVVAVLNIYFFYLAYSSGLSFIVVR